MTELQEKAMRMALDYIRREGWTNSQGKEVFIALQEALAQPEQEPVPGHGKQLHDQLITAIHQLLNAKDEPSSWGQVGPDAFDIAWHQVTALVSHICTAIDSPDTPPKREWVDLDEEEQKECWDEGGSQRAIYQNIASKLKEKNT